MTDMDLDPGFVKTCMWDQLGKIEDSAGNPYPRDDVTTDDGVKFTGITFEEATAIKEVVQTVKSSERLEVLKKIQMSEGFKMVLGYVRKSI